MGAMQITEEESKKGTPAPRFEGQALQVKARTIGTKISFEMPVANVSVSGLLLSWKDPRKSPFAVNTILEMEIQHTASSQSRSIGCLGKVVRRFSTDTGTPSFGVKIIQTEADEQQAWRGIIDAICLEG